MRHPGDVIHLVCSGSGMKSFRSIHPVIVSMHRNIYGPVGKHSVAS
jgi:hypothetical protein